MSLNSPTVSNTFLILIMSDQLEMLTAREQLMEDIDCIIESNFGEVEYKDDVIRMLCDAVCRNFPVK